MIRPPGWENAGTTEFGDSETLSDWLVSLILQGKKTATCGALRDYHQDGTPLTLVGQRDLVLDFAGRAVAGIEYTEVTLLRYREVPEAFALAEGEGSFQDWQDGHRAYFTRNGGWSPEMLLVCERFRLISRFDPGAAPSV